MDGARPCRGVVFTASADHSTNVTNYVLKVFASTVNPLTGVALATSDLGKPVPASTGEITVDRQLFFGALPPGSYVATVTAVRPGGQTPSAGVAFTRGENGGNGGRGEVHITETRRHGDGHRARTARR